MRIGSLRGGLGARINVQARLQPCCSIAPPFRCSRGAQASLRQGPGYRSRRAASVAAASSTPFLPAATSKVLGTQLGSVCHQPVAQQPAFQHSSGRRSLLLVTAIRKPAAKIKRRPASKTGPAHQEIGPQRLSKVLAAAGVASRRAAEELIFSGDVKLNGKVVTLPQTLAHPITDKIEVKGKPVTAQPQRKFYFAINKPKGYACTSAAGEGEGGGGKLVLDLLEPWVQRWRKEHPRGTLPPRLFTVGRLDVATVGLLFVTNDGQWAQQVMHPASGLTKEYVATVDKPATRRQLELVAAGCEVDGVMVQPVAVGIDNSDPANNGRKIRIMVAEGRNREVRTLLGNVGLTVTFLKRVRIGGFRLSKDLALGTVKPLKPNEVRRTLDKGAQDL